MKDLPDSDVQESKLVHSFCFSLVVCKQCLHKKQDNVHPRMWASRKSSLKTLPRCSLWAACTMSPGWYYDKEVFRQPGDFMELAVTFCPRPGITLPISGICLSKCWENWETWYLWSSHTFFSWLLISMFPYFCLYGNWYHVNWQVHLLA